MFIEESRTAVQAASPMRMYHDTTYSTFSSSRSSKTTAVSCITVWDLVDAQLSTSVLVYLVYNCKLCHA